MGPSGWWRVIRLTNLAQIRRRPLRAALAVVSVAAGVSLCSAVAIEQHSFTASTREVARQLAGPTPLRVIGPSSHGGLPDTTAATIRAVPGVSAAVPVVRTVAEVRGPRAHVFVVALGVDLPHTPPYAATTADLIRQVGDGAVLRTDVGRVPLRVAPAPPQFAHFNAGRAVLLPLATAQRVFARAGQVDTVYVVPDPGVRVDQLRKRLVAALPVQDTVLRAGDRVSSGGGNLLVPLLGLIALVALAVSGLLVWNMASLALAERRRELAVAAALGATPRITVVGVLAEAVAQGVVGGALGSLGGWALAHPLVQSLSDQTEMFAGIHLHVHASTRTLLVGPLLGAVTASVAAWVPARRATRLDVAAELHARSTADAPQAARSARATLGTAAVGAVGVAACLVASRHAATSTWQPPLGLVGLVVSMVALTGLTLSLAPLVVRALEPLARRRGGVVHVAVRALAAEPRRTGIAATAVAAAVSFSSVLVGAIPAINDVTVKLFGSVVDGRVYVSTLQFNNTAAIDSKASPGLRQRLATLPDVARVDASVFVAAPVDGQRIFVAAADGPAPTFDAVEGSADPAALDRGEAFIGPAVARRNHLHPGSLITLDSPAGRVHLPVAAVWTDPNDVGASMTVSMATLTRLFGPQPPTALFVVPKAGVSADRLAAEIRAAHVDPDLVVQTPRQFFDALSGSVESMMSPFWTLQKSLLLVALVATLSTLLLVGVQRRRELGTLAALGLAPRALASMTVVEAMVVGVAGCVLGVASGIVGSIGLLADSVFVMGASASFTFDPPATAGYAAVALLVVAIGASWPAWRTSRLVVVEALRHE
jgi:putative ABC transport system permease protein